MKRQRFSVISHICDEAVGKLMVDIVRNSHPLFRLMGESVIYEGDSGEIVGDSDIATSDFSTITGHFQLDHDTARKVDLEGFRKSLEKGFLEIHRSQHTALFEQMNQVMENENRVLHRTDVRCLGSFGCRCGIRWIYLDDRETGYHKLVFHPLMMPRFSKLRRIGLMKSRNNSGEHY